MRTKLPKLAAFPPVSIYPVRRRLIDVFDRQYIAIVFPVPKLESALKSEAEEFKEAYGRDKPAEDADIIFTCRSGRRAENAGEIAKNAGFTK